MKTLSDEIGTAYLPLSYLSFRTVYTGASMLTNLLVLSTMKNACGYGRRFNFQ
jgi:hypothetical protein